MSQIGSTDVVDNITVTLKVIWAICTSVPDIPLTSDIVKYDRIAECCHQNLKTITLSLSPLSSMLRTKRFSQACSRLAST
jgi:hypothetical protein